MIFKLIPFSGLYPLSFGMSIDEIEEIIGEKKTAPPQFGRGTVKYNSGLTIEFQNGKAVEFSLIIGKLNSDGVLIKKNSDIKIIYNGQKFFEEKSAEEIFTFFSSKEPPLIFKDISFFLDKGIGISGLTSKTQTRDLVVFDKKLIPEIESYAVPFQEELNLNNSLQEFENIRSASSTKLKKTYNFNNKTTKTNGNVYMGHTAYSEIVTSYPYINNEILSLIEVFGFHIVANRISFKENDTNFKSPTILGFGKGRFGILTAIDQIGSIAENNLPIINMGENNKDYLLITPALTLLHFNIDEKSIKELNTTFNGEIFHK